LGMLGVAWASRFEQRRCAAMSICRRMPALCVSSSPFRVHRHSGVGAARWRLGGVFVRNVLGLALAQFV